MPPPMIRMSTFLTRLLSSSSLPETLAPPTIAATRADRRAQRQRQRVELLLHRPAGVGRHVVGEALGRGVGAVGGGEGVVDVDVAQLGELGDELRLVLFFRLVEAGVLEAENVAVLHRRDRLGGRFADAVGGESDRPFDHVRHRRGDGLEGEGWVGLALRAAQMGHEDDFAALVGDLEDRRRDALDAGEIGHPPVFDGDVEVDAQQDALSLDVGGIESAEGGHRQAPCAKRRDKSHY